MGGIWGGGEEVDVHACTVGGIFCDHNYICHLPSLHVAQTGCIPIRVSLAACAKCACMVEGNREFD